jgi:hypothetical protein
MERTSQSPLQKKGPKSISSQRLTIDLLEKSDLSCPVCFQFIAEPTVTPCAHLFCIDCIRNVMGMKNSCPLCRSTFPEDFTP